MEWRDINECPDHTKGVFGYWNQFDEFFFEVWSSKDQPLKVGYTHWLDIKEPNHAALL